MTTPAETEVRPRWLDDREKDVWLALRRLMWGLTPAIDRQLTRESNLSGPEYSVLATLSECPNGVLRSGTAAHELGWERSRLSHILRRMEAKGLIHRTCSADDARGQDVHLTEAGRAAIVEAAPGHVEFVRRTVFDPLTPDQQDMLGEACARIAAAIAAIDGTPEGTTEGAAEECEADH
ncbi:MarR family winged helix-turn-helix transcriptional regulator [Sinomonas notoginsengisoli]|uniref:MarR family winged helix-turn-helix transcriptional regulator n=1 Tax=Sinomonas notoginsengisoli TaxID=1457311 RepID=UPI001F36F0C0|nr:MarR family winged helix-turn-helix transcriptional regulator [Sinomonas notoginsengisoli]